MMTKDYRAAYESLPNEARMAVMALSVLIDRIAHLPSKDRDDLFELAQEWRKTGDAEEVAEIQRAMEEILAQIPITASALPEKSGQTTGKLAGWTQHVGKKIRELRESAGLSQVALATKAGIPQSHLSRLENAQHSPTALTLEKIAVALGVDVGSLDPCGE